MNENNFKLTDEALSYIVIFIKVVEYLLLRIKASSTNMVEINS